MTARAIPAAAAASLALCAALFASRAAALPGTAAAGRSQGARTPPAAGTTAALPAASSRLGVGPLLHQVVELEHVHHADGDLLLEWMAGTAVVHPVEPATTSPAGNGARGPPPPRQEPDDPPSPEPEPEAGEEPESPDAGAPPGEPEALARWREALELDLAGEVVREGMERVREGGDLARDGRAVALVARALFATDPRAPFPAESLLESARPDEATAPWVALERARLWIELDRLRPALELLLPRRGAGTGSGERAAGEGESTEGAGTQAAEAARRTSLEPIHPEIPESWLLAGRALNRSGEIERAAPFFERFLELAPRDIEAPSALHALARRELARADGDAARALVERAGALEKWHAFHRARRLQVRENPGEPLPRLGLAELYLKAGEPARARGVLEELVARSPDYCPGWFHLGEAARLVGDASAALAHYDRALDCDPGQLLARYHRGVLRMQRGETAEARVDFEELVRGEHAGDARVLHAHLGLARILYNAGEAKPALARYQRYVELGGREPLDPSLGNR